MTDVKLNCYCYLKPFNCVQKNKQTKKKRTKSSGTFKNVINKMCLQIMYI